MDDQQSVASSVVDPFGLQRRNQTQSAAHTSSVTIETNLHENIQDYYSDTNQANLRRLETNDSRLIQKRNTFSLNGFVEKPKEFSKEFQASLNLGFDSRGSGNSFNNLENSTKVDKSAVTRSRVNVPLHQQQTRWTAETLRTVTEDYGDSDEETLNLRSPQRSRALEFETGDQRILTRDMRHFEYDYMRSSSSSNNDLGSPSPIDISSRSILDKRNSTATTEIMPSPNGISKASTAVKTLEAFQTSIQLQTGLESQRNVNSTTAIRKVSNHSQSLENLKVSYGSPSTNISQLSSSPIEHDPADVNFIERTISVPAPSPNRHLSLSSNSNATAAVSSRTHQLTSKMIAQLQAQLEECQRELINVTNEKQDALLVANEFKEQAKRLESELRQARTDQIDPRQKVELDMKERELQQWESQLHQESVDIQTIRDETNRRKTSMNGLEKTVAALETTHQEEQARLSSWERRLSQQEEIMVQNNLVLTRLRDEVEHERREWESHKVAEQEECRSERRRLAGWEKRLRQHEDYLLQFHTSLNEIESNLLSQQSEVDRDRADIQSKLKDLDAKASQTEAKLQLMEQAIKDVQSQQKEEEEKLKELVQRRIDEESLAEKEAEEWEEIKETVASEIQKSEEQLQGLVKQVEVKQKGFVSMQERFDRILSEENKKKERISKETTSADQGLSAILSQLQVAQREKRNIENDMKQKKIELDDILHQMEQEERRWNREQNQLLKEKIELQELKNESARQAQQIVATATDRLRSFAKELENKQTQSSLVLEKRFEMLEKLHQNVELAANEYKDKFKQLQKDEEYCRHLRSQLEEKANLASDREERIRRDCKLKLESLQKRLDNELNNRQYATDKVEEKMRQDVDKVRSIMQQLELTTSERDRYRRENNSRRAEIEQRDDELTSLRESFAQDCESLEQEIVEAMQRVKLADTLSQSLHREKEERTKEIESMKVIMDRLERQASMLEESKEVWDNERLRLKNIERDFEDRMSNIKEKEQSLLEEGESIELKRRQLEHGFQQLSRQKQKAALSQFFAKPLRCEQEEVSAAFSKWVRATMFQVDEADKLELTNSLKEKLDIVQQERDELHGIREQLQLEREQLGVRENAIKQELLDFQRDLNRRAEALESEALRLQEEKNLLSSEVNLSTNKENEIFSYIDREVELETKEKELIMRQKQFQEYEQNTAREFEAANDRIRKMAELLSVKEKAISTKHEQLHKERIELAAKQSKLRNLFTEFQRDSFTEGNEDGGIQSSTPNLLVFEGLDSPNRLSRIHDENDSFDRSPPRL